jgi:ubiquinone/menaquinone biosynthesis C-methylase UbiE
VSLYEAQILPRLIDLVLRGREFDLMRHRVAANLEGDVVEIGFGSGRNVPHYPTSVTRVRAVDPATVGRTLASRRVAASPIPVEYVGLDGQDLPLEDSSVDNLLTTWTLCTIPDVHRALTEARRVLRPGGAIHFVEHGRSPSTSVARWQDRLTPIQRRLFGGCHLNRPIDRLLIDADFELTRIENYYARGPKPFGYMFEGVATKTSA